MSDKQAPSKITQGNDLPDKDVTFAAYKFKDLHEMIMCVTTDWSKESDGVYAHTLKCKALAYHDALTTVLVGTVSSKAYHEICDEYLAMIFGKCPSKAIISPLGDKP